MENETLQFIRSKKDEIIHEISEKMKCTTEDFEILKLESGNICIFWNALYQRGIIQSHIPHNWIVTVVDWKEHKLSMYTWPENFKTLTSKKIPNPG